MDTLPFEFEAYEECSKTTVRVQSKGAGENSNATSISLTKGHQGTTNTRRKIKGRMYGPNDFDVLVIVRKSVIAGRWTEDEGIYLLDWPKHRAKRIFVRHLREHKAKEWKGWIVEEVIEEDHEDQIDMFPEKEEPKSDNSEEQMKWDWGK